MTLKDQVFAQAVLLAGDLDARQTELLNALCTASTASLTARLKEGLSPEDCRAEFVAAASLFALSALNEADSTAQVEEFKAGDLTVKQGSRKDAASRCLQDQAEQMMRPFLKDTFSFLGV